MNTSDFVNPSSSPTSDQEQPPSSHPVAGIEAINDSVAKLIRNWKRRQIWRRLLINNGATATTSESLPVGSDGTAAWRKALANLLESNVVHMVTFLLLIGDVVITIVELSSSVHSRCTKKTRDGQDLWYHWVEITILCVLLLKSLGLILGLGASFFVRPGYVVDATVLVGAIFMESFLEGKGGGLLVVVSLWRILRVVESAFELSDKAIETQIKEIRQQLKSLRENKR
ncbi:hypothetical protein SAY87_002568 [Trapa incisa]|uniref:Voltage-gated hydrogen channel 1 n=1 Tax=Trapa incisa TaxID=236973 RepID=A0AAN7PVB6_9MYRT|nr:hypothetical protein SAY87_002563 [Trapa incisa]KAK4754464.1 hypothetical protein SAY87_002568 [Trapa incisa]